MPSTFADLKARNYCLYWFGLVFYVLGHRAEYVTFAWMTWEVTHDPLSLGYLGLAQGAPLAVFQLFGGVLADRTDRLRLLIYTQALTAVVLAIAFALTVLGQVRLEHLLVLAALSNTFRAFDEPTRLAMIPQLIDRARLPNAIALGSIPSLGSSSRPSAAPSGSRWPPAPPWWPSRCTAACRCTEKRRAATASTSCASSPTASASWEATSCSLA